MTTADPQQFIASLPPPPPTGTEARVCADIAARQRLGVAKYGTTVADNPLSLDQWLQHAYEEALDMAVYLRRAIEERRSMVVGRPTLEAALIAQRMETAKLAAAIHKTLNDNRHLADGDDCTLKVLKDAVGMKDAVGFDDAKGGEA